MQQMMPYIPASLRALPFHYHTPYSGLISKLYGGARKWRQTLSGGNAKTIADIENAIQNIQAAMQRTRLHQRTSILIDVPKKCDINHTKKYHFTNIKIQIYGNIPI